MKTSKVSFQNNDGQTLSARMEFPADETPRAYAIFAHCFTCNKNLTAVMNLSRALAHEGIGVLRFDFTGLGESEGEFEETNFSSNVEDLICAANFLAEKYKAPQIIIGHSLGGAAAIFAADQLESIRAIATIGAPSNVSHVKHLLKESLEELEKVGSATATISGRSFEIKAQFLRDIDSQKLGDTLKDFRKPILIMHSPQDEVVSIDNAAELYDKAWHPKSFISLDGADHMMSDKSDSAYAGQVIASWASRYVEAEDSQALESDKQVVARLEGDQGFTTEIKAGKHPLTADEPESAGGNDFGPTPYELVSSGLAACTAMTMKMYADRKEWKLQEVIVHVEYQKKHADDCDNCDKDKSRIDHFQRTIEVAGDLTDDQCSRLLEIANKCPVHKTLETESFIDTAFKQPGKN